MLIRETKVNGHTLKKLALRHSSRADAERIIKKLILLRYMSF